ncbi:tyrosine-type recombinase/integrase [Pseudodesulfovibrio karagichevae]|uniref:Tyrosine-type recombinase/integrase n=1 Tax=Pseudodesulfovibrio karagichevae TaxID=3239305 RepID=A0ABV4K6S2_9BACT
MAIREKKKKGGGKFWEVYWKNPFTKRIQSKNFHDEKEAKDFNTDVLYRLKRDKESFRPAQAASDAPLTHFQGLALRYLVEKPMAKSTKDTTLCHLEAFYSILGNPEIAEIDKAMMKHFERELRKPHEKTYTGPNGKKWTRTVKGAEQNTIKRKVGIVLAILNWAAEEEYIPGHNLTGYKCAPGDDKKLVPPTPEELKRIRKVAPKHVDRAIYFAFNFGLRVGNSELFRVTWDRIDFDRKVATIPAAKKGKGQWRQVPIREDVLPVLKQWKAEDDECGATHIINYRGKPVASIRKAFNSTLEKAGITRKIRPYDLRHAFATYALEAGADPNALRKLMGHSSMAMIYKNYQHVLDKQKEAVVNGLPSI